MCSCTISSDSAELVMQMGGALRAAGRVKVHDPSHLISEDIPSVVLRLAMWSPKLAHANVM